MEIAIQVDMEVDRTPEKKKKESGGWCWKNYL